MSTCRKCGNPVDSMTTGATFIEQAGSTTPADGPYHPACAREMWVEKRAKDAADREAVRDRRSKHATENFRGGAPMASSNDADDGSGSQSS